MKRTMILLMAAAAIAWSTMLYAEDKAPAPKARRTQMQDPPQHMQRWIERINKAYEEKDFRKINQLVKRYASTLQNQQAPNAAGRGMRRQGDIDRPRAQQPPVQQRQFRQRRPGLDGKAAPQEGLRRDKGRMRQWDDQANRPKARAMQRGRRPDATWHRPERHMGQRPFDMQGPRGRWPGYTGPYARQRGFAPPHFGGMNQPPVDRQFRNRSFGQFGRPGLGPDFQPQRRWGRPWENNFWSDDF